MIEAFTLLLLKLTTVRVISRIIVDENHVFVTNLKQKKNIKM